jgi:hypothetical protein
VKGVLKSIGELRAGDERSATKNGVTEATKNDVTEAKKWITSQKTLKVYFDLTTALPRRWNINATSMEHQ